MDDLFLRLSKSKFRNSFHLKQDDIDYINKKGIDVIKSHAYDFILKNLAPEVILNDGKQVPYKGHPVFIARHATATCCRGCLNKWHHIPLNQKLTDNEIDYVINIIMTWINNEYNNFNNK